MYCLPVWLLLLLRLLLLLLLLLLLPAEPIFVPDPLYRMRGEHSCQHLFDLSCGPCDYNRALNTCSALSRDHLFSQLSASCHGLICWVVSSVGPDRFVDVLFL